MNEFEMEMTKESIKERQESELEVLKSIFGEEVEDLRPKQKKWKPLNVKINLTPQRGSSGDQKIYTKASLHVICSSKYPQYVPKIILEDSKGLSDALCQQLLDELNCQAASLEGEVMIFELCTTVQAFLHKHNNQPSGSFYDEMISSHMKRDSEVQKLKETEEDQKKKELMDQLLKRKQELKNEMRSRRETIKRSMSECSPTHHTPSSSENSENSPMLKLNVSISEADCTEHHKSEILYFANVGRKIQKGSCLGHSQVGSIAFSGIDLDTGQLLYITEWFLRYNVIEAQGLKIEEIIQRVEKEMSTLQTLHHKNLISYEYMSCQRRKDGILINLVQEFILGTSLSNISSYISYTSEVVSRIAKGILNALTYLHSNGVTHNNLYDSAVFLDNYGNIRVTDYSLTAYLQEISTGQKHLKPDLPALGALIESLSPTPELEMRDFIEKCKSTRTFSINDLQGHPFLRSSIVEQSLKQQIVPLYGERPHSSQLVPFNASQVAAEKSRLQTEFQIIDQIGKGAYGAVLKCRNILDNRVYAIKRIPLPARSKQLFRKITREVELLSRLNHENVVRYYHSWIESAVEEDDQLKALAGTGTDLSMSFDSRKASGRQARVIQESDDSSSSNDWLDSMPYNDSSSDGIAFVDSNGEVVSYEEEQDEEDKEPSARNIRNEIQYMFIQMEYCDKSTLRTAIDEGLYQDIDRQWRLFREICEGLLHIHKQGIIHRDLKPVNIFLDSRDSCKIGDLGLATTSILALQDTVVSHSSAMQSGIGSMTGKVGTALYVAPELSGIASKSTYNQKVDLYSLGIILFEMCSPPLTTGMERVKTIMALRSTSIVIPDTMVQDKTYSQQVQVIKWLLNHDPKQRPTTEQLLTSDLLPPAKKQENEMQDMVKNVLANPQSRLYKYLISKCLAQESDIVCQLTYHDFMIPIVPLLEFIKNKIVGIFTRHGAIEVITPLLTPYKSNTFTNAVRLMTHSGSVVTLPHDMRLPFLRHVALNGLTYMRRYSIGRVYREKKVFNFHPKQITECAFDIITPTKGNLLVDAELLFIANEIVNELPALKKQNISFRINHSNLLKSILLYCNIPTDKYTEVLSVVNDFLEGKISKFQLTSTISSILQNFPKHSISNLIELFQLDCPMLNLDSTSLRTLMKGKGEASQLAKGAIKEIDTVISLAKNFGVLCPIHVNPGFCGGEIKTKSGIMWQMLMDVKGGRYSKMATLAAGGRYDSIIQEQQKTGVNAGLNIPNRGLISGVGFSFALDKLVYALRSCEETECNSSDVLICISGSRPPMQDAIQVLRSLWSANIKACTAETNLEEAQEIAKELGAKHVILIAEGGVLRVLSWVTDKFYEKNVKRPELIDYIQKVLVPDSQLVDTYAMSQLSLNSAPVAKSNSNNSYGLPTLDFVFVVAEKITVNKRKRYENQIEQNVSPILAKFVKKEKIIMIAVELSKSVLRALIAVLDPQQFIENLRDDFTAGLNQLIEKFPKQKRILKEIYDEIFDILSDTKNPCIVGIYSLSDSYYRLLL